MAGKSKAMSQIKQLLSLHNRAIPLKVLRVI